jgi:hypothetical protein
LVAAFENRKIEGLRQFVLDAEMTAIRNSLGTSYLTGKHLLDQLMKDRSHQLGKEFTTSRFFEAVNAVGLIPVSLIRWQLTGLDDEIRGLVRPK